MAGTTKKASAGKKVAKKPKVTKAKPAKKPEAIKPKPAKKAASKKTARPSSGPAFWLFKSEPDVFSWDDLVKKGAKGEEWDGVRNYLARNNMREMKIGDLGFFYHSNLGKEVVGICEVCALAHSDSTTDDPRWECVDVRAVCPMPNFVTLADVKGNEKLADMALVTSMRLSVQPVKPAEWKEVCRMGKLDPKKINAAS